MGSATGVVITTDVPVEGRAAVPAYVDERLPIVGPARAVQVVTSGPMAGGPPMPVRLAPAGAPAIGPALPIYLVAGSLTTLGYTDNVRAITAAPLLEYYPLADASGSTAVDESGNGRNGTYGGGVTLGVTGIGDGRTAASFSTGNVNIYTAGFAGAFNGQEFASSIWLKVSGAGVWTDGTVRRALSLRTTGSDLCIIARDVTNNSLTITYTATSGGSVTKALTLTGLSTTDWFHLGVIISKSGDYARAYYNGVQAILTQTGLGTFTGSLSTTLTTLAAGSTSNVTPWSGAAAHAAIFGSGLTSADMAILGRLGRHIVCEGDSRTTESSISWPMQAGFTTAGFADVATSGDKVSDMITQATNTIDPLIRGLLTNVAVVWGGLNDATAGASATTIYNRLVSWCQGRRAAGFRVVVCTEIDAQSAATDAVGWHSTIYPALNTLIRNNWSTFADGLADLAANSALQDATNTTYYNADKVHLVSAGYAVVSNIIKPVVLSV